jgi:carbonyl reductase 1
MKSILVTGGNCGIGFALCKRLVKEGHRVFLGSRSRERGEDAIKKINGGEQCSLVVLDVTSEDSVKAAADLLKDVNLYAIVNNAGTGLGHNTTVDDIINVNLFGAKRVTDAFLPMLQKDGGRIANTSSGAASGYVSGKMFGSTAGVCTKDQRRPLIDPNVTWEQIEEIVEIERAAGYTKETGEGKKQNASLCAYGLSKACMTAMAMMYAREHPTLHVTSCSPGFIKTKMTAAFGATLTPEEGIISLMHCLFADLTGQNGFYFGSDAKRSPLHIGRNPGEPEYNGEPGEPGTGWE